MSISRQYAEIAVPRRLFRLFTYAIPEALAGPWEPGMQVRVPFGREVLTGYIVRLTSEPTRGDVRGKPLKEILARLDDIPTLSPELLALTQWLAERYLAAPGQCLRLAFPGQVDAAKRPRTRYAMPPRPPGPQGSMAGVAALPAALVPVREQVLNALSEHRSTMLLLPGSSEDAAGLYREAVHSVLRLGGSALVLVPETDHVEPLRRLLSQNGRLSCAGYHGDLPLAQRQHLWKRIQQGEVRAVVGTRSATFLPLQRVGLIIVDHEDHAAYKAQNAPRYDTRVVAAERARRQQCVLILASAHPSLDAVHATGAASVNVVSRLSPSLMVRVVNLRDTPGDILSATMIEAIEKHLAAGHQILLYINRKGYASILLCRDCGDAVRCPSCHVGWSFQKQQGVLSCTHCGRRDQAPAACPACRGVRLFATGFGTEAVEEAVRKIFPEARVARLERNRGRKKEDDTITLERFRRKEIDILVGTQLLASTMPRPYAALIGIIAPDAALHLPDFLAAERAYHTLREIMALADPGVPDAAVILQTYMPEHHVIRALAAHNPAVFYQNELAARAALGYPPFGRLIALRVSGTNEDRAANAANRWAELLRGQAVSCEDRRPAHKAETRFDLLGPIPAVPLRLRGRFRWQLLVKGIDGAVLRQEVRTTLDTLQSSGHGGNLRYDIDVDPQSLLT